MQITADVSKISKTVQRDLTFISNNFSQSVIDLVSIFVSYDVKNIVSFT